MKKPKQFLKLLLAVFITMALCCPLAFANGCIATGSAVVNSGSSNWPYHPAGSSFEEGTSVAYDANGNVYVVGDFDSDITFSNQLTTSGGSDIFLAKFNSAGTVQWEIKIGSSTGDDFAKKIIINGNGDIVITGSCYDGCAFGNGYISPTTGKNVIFVAKYNTSGTCTALYTNTTGTTFGIGNDIAIDASNNVYIVGTIDNGSNTDIILLGINPGLTAQLWNPKTENSGFDDEGRGIAYCSANSVKEIIITGNYYNEILVSEYSSGGTFIQSNITLNIFYAYGQGKSIIAESGYAYIAGTDGNILIFGVDVGTLFQSAARHITGNGVDYATDLDFDHNGDIYVTGQFSSTSTLNFPTNGSNIPLSLSGTSTWNHFLAKYNKVYNLFYWAKQSNGNSTTEETMGICANYINDAFGNCYGFVTGVFSGDIEFDNSGSLVASNYDAYITRFHDYYNPPNSAGAYNKLITPDSIHDNSNVNYINIYPNPAGDNIFIDISFEKEVHVKIEMLDLLGNIIKKIDDGLFSNKHVIVETTDLANGVYIIKIITPVKSILKKLAIIK